MSVEINGKQFEVDSNKEYYDKNKDTIICKSCGEDKLIKDDGFVIRALCSCESNKIDEENKARQTTKKLALINEYKKNSLVGKRFENANINDIRQDDKLIFAVNKYCEKFDKILKKGHSLYLYGSVGIGKTYIAAAIGNKLTEKLYTVKFTSFIEILKSVKDLFNNKYNNYSSKTYLDELAKVDLLIIDDLGIERKQNYNQDNYTQEIVYDIINKRYIDKKPIIFTSNYSISDLVIKRGLWQRTADRIAGMSKGLVFYIEGENKRIGEEI